MSRLYAQIADGDVLVVLKEVADAAEDISEQMNGQGQRNLLWLSVQLRDFIDMVVAADDVSEDDYKTLLGFLEKEKSNAESKGDISGK